jgi:hypothetical protein
VEKENEGGGKTEAVRAMAHGGWGVAAVSGGGLLLVVAMTSMVEVRIRVVYGRQPPSTIEAFGGWWETGGGRRGGRAARRWGRCLDHGRQLGGG